MALTITTNLINLEASGTTAFTYGQRLEWDVSILSNASPDGFFGNSLFFNPALWLEVGIPNNNATIVPDQGYGTTFGLIPATGFLEVVNASENTLPWDNLRVEYDLVSDLILNLKFIFIQGFDLCGYMENATLDNSGRLSKNSQNNTVSFNNDISSVYNEEKTMRAHIMIANTATQSILDQVHATYLIENRYLEGGVLGGAPEFTDWSFELERGGVIVEDLSTAEDTTFRAFVDIGAGTISPDTSILIYRDDNNANLVGFVEDMKLGYEDSTGAKEGIDYPIAFVPWVLDAGTVYKAEWTLDKTKFDFGGTYKFIVIVANDPTTLYNSGGTKSLIAATALPTATTGTMTGIIDDYNSRYTGDCLQVTAYERIKSCVEVDKASYDTALGAQSLPGDFDSNFFSLRVRLILLDNNIVNALDPTNTVVIDVNDKQGAPELTIQDTFNDYISCLIFRVQPEWANTPFMVIHTFTYKIGSDPADGFDNPYDDIVHFPQLFNLNGLEEDTGNNFLTSIVFKDQAGDIVKEICEDFDGPMVVEVTKVATGLDYNLIAAIKPDIVNNVVDEEESYNNGLLDQLDSSLLLNVDTLFVANVATFEVEDTLLELGQKYRVIGIAKEENLTPPTICPIINIATDTDCTAVGGSTFADYDINFAVTNFAPSAVTNVDISTDIDQFSTGPQINNFVLSTGTYAFTVTWPSGYNNNPITILMDIDVTLANGCTYSYTAEHVVIPLVGSTTEDEADVNAD